MPFSVAVAAQGCLPPGANVCVAAPANQISSAIRVFFRISDMGCEPIVGVPSFFSLTVPFPTRSLPSLKSGLS